MKSKKIWANLGVGDLKRTTEFYNALGFKPNGKHSVTNELTSFLVGDDDFVLHFFLKGILEANMKIKMADPKNAIEVMFTLSAESKDQVDKWAKEVEKAGGKIISRPEEFGEGYYGFVFADPDGHAFNVFFM
ncbi:MAG: VOC family protein [Ferruginibacter sp.]